ncbi:MAG: S24 family peptidase, partial [Pseudomonadota bacterium]
SLRSVRYHEARQAGLFDGSGLPVGDDWDEIDFPGIADKHTFALEIQGDRLRPAYRDGDILVVSPTASIRRHDHVVLKARSGALSVGILLRRTAQRVELEAPGDEEGKLIFKVNNVEWLSRVIWAKLGS